MFIWFRHKNRFDSQNGVVPFALSLFSFKIQKHSNKNGDAGSLTNQPKSVLSLPNSAAKNYDMVTATPSIVEPYLPLPLSNPSFLDESALLLGRKQTELTKCLFSNHKTKKLQFVNLQYKRVWWESGKRFLKLGLSTKALKTIEKNCRLV